jgi:acyl-CoA thioester hydrolase
MPSSRIVDRDVLASITCGRSSSIIHGLEISTTPLPAFRFAIRVYWEDTDAGGVVFYANYLKFFERARTEWLRSLGVGQQRLKDEAGAMFVVSATNVRYLKPARLDDEVEITVVIKEAGRASMTIDQEAWRGTELLAAGTIRIGCVDAETFRPRRIPMSFVQDPVIDSSHRRVEPLKPNS